MPALFLILALVAFRLLPHPDNFAPLAAFALLSGFYFGRRIAILVPVAALILSDLFINMAMGYPALYWPRIVDWSAFALIGFAGWSLRGATLFPKLGAAFATPFAFFLISNLGVWLFGRGLSGMPYAKSAAGLIECYAAGIPFLRASVLGDWIFMAAFVGVMALAGLRQPKAVEAR